MMNIYKKDDSNKIFDSQFASKLGEDIKNKEKENEEDLLIIDTSSKKTNEESNINLNNDIIGQQKCIMNKIAYRIFPNLIRSN